MRARDHRSGLGVLLGAIVIVSVGGSPRSTVAHSMADVEVELEAGEPAAEVFDEPMPSLEFEDREGSLLRLTDFRGGVVVLSFDDNRDRRSCAAIDATVAKVRALVGEAEGLGSQLRFVTVIAGSPGDEESSNEICEEGSTQLEPQTALYARLGGSTSQSRLAGAFGFGPGVTSGAIVVGPSGRIRARFRGPEFAPVWLMMFAAALAHGQHGDPGGAKDAEVTSEPDRTSLRLALGGVFALSGALAYGLYTLWRRRTLTRDAERNGR